MAEVTTANELNAYTGNAALGGSEASGYAPLNLSPLQTYALNKYQTNVLDFNQQQADKKALQDKYTDPSLYLFLDENYANQINPKLDELKELAKKNLQLDPNGKDWYRFHNLYNEILRDNAGLKAVQNLKDKYKKLAEDTPDVHEKERLDGFVNQLNNWKLGEDIPTYNKYFGPNMAHLPPVKQETATFFELGKTPEGYITKRTVKRTVNDIHNLMGDAEINSYKDPATLKTGGDFAHSFLEMGQPGIDEANEQASNAYRGQIALDINRLQNKYSSEWDRYQRIHPERTFRDFMEATGRDQELQAIYDSKDILPFKNGLSIVDAAVDPYELQGFTYFTDPKSGKKVRLNLSDAQMNGFMAGTQSVPGGKTEVVKEELADEIIKDKRERDKNAKDYQVEMAKIAQKKYEFNKLHPDVDIPDSDFGNLIYGVNTDVVDTKSIGSGVTNIKNGTLVDKDGNIVKTYNGVLKIPASAFNNSIVTEYNKYAGEKSVTKTEGETTDEGGNTTKSTTTQTQLAGQIDLSSGQLRAKFQNGVIKGIYAKDGTLIDDDMFQHITRLAGQKGVTKYKSPDTQYGKQNSTTVTFDIVDPNTGKVLMSGVSEQDANKAKAKGYNIK